MIVLNPDHSAHYLLKAAFEAEGISWRPHVECHLFAPGCRMAAEGAGIAIVDPFTAHDFADKGLVFRPFEPRIPYDLGVIFPALRPRARLTLEFTKALKSALRKMLLEHQANALQPDSATV